MAILAAAENAKVQGEGRSSSAAAGHAMRHMLSLRRACNAIASLLLTPALSAAVSALPPAHSSPAVQSPLPSCPLAPAGLQPPALRQRRRAAAQRHRAHAAAWISCVAAGASSGRQQRGPAGQQAVGLQVGRAGSRSEEGLEEARRGQHDMHSRHDDSPSNRLYTCSASRCMELLPASTCHVEAFK